MSTAEFLEFLRKYIGEPLHQILIEAAHLANIAIEVAVEAGDLQDRHRRAPLVASFVSQAVQLVSTCSINRKANMYVHRRSTVRTGEG